MFNKLVKKFKKVFVRKHSSTYQGRRPYHVGWLAPDKSLDDLKLFLHNQWGFGRNIMHVDEPGLVLSWQKVTPDHGSYNIRVYSDGEIRGHYEVIPETGVLERKEDKGEAETKEEFLRFLDGFSVDKKFVTALTPSPSDHDPKPEILQDEPGEVSAPE